MRKLGCLGLLIVLAAIAAAFFGLQIWAGPGPLKRNTTVTITQGTSLATASTQLEKAGAIGSANQFRLFARFLGSGDPIKAGEYRLPAHLSQADILKVLQGGKTLQRFVTIPEGWPSVMVKAALDKTPGLEGTAAVPVEGTVLPDSYSFERGYTRQSMVDRMQRAMARYLASAC